ncbi:MAG: CBS domain-containing protein [archaeon]|nr:CBS domain-containing protein [archaeon]
MEFPTIAEIKKIRKSLDITQEKLASESGISQSTIAKIEKGTISARYTTIVKLFETLDKMRFIEKKDFYASDVSSKNIVSIQNNMTVRDASELMKSTGYSQLPVLDGERPVGSISEKEIFELVRNGMTMDELSRKPINKIMGKSYPVVTENTPIGTVTAHMASSNAILVTKNGKIVGMITKADLLKLI